MKNKLKNFLHNVKVRNVASRSSLHRLVMDFNYRDFSAKLAAVGFVVLIVCSLPWLFLECRSLYTQWQAERQTKTIDAIILRISEEYILEPRHTKSEAFE